MNLLAVGVFLMKSFCNLKPYVSICPLLLTLACGAGGGTTDPDGQIGPSADYIEALTLSNEESGIDVKQESLTINASDVKPDNTTNNDARITQDSIVEPALGNESFIDILDPIASIDMGVTSPQNSIIQVVARDPNLIKGTIAAGIMGNLKVAVHTVTNEGDILFRNTTTNVIVRSNTKWVVSPDPIASTTTDEAGNYEVKIPEDSNVSYLIVASWGPQSTLKCELLKRCSDVISSGSTGEMDQDFTLKAHIPSKDRIQQGDIHVNLLTTSNADAWLRGASNLPSFKFIFNTDDPTKIPLIDLNGPPSFEGVDIDAVTNTLLHYSLLSVAASEFMDNNNLGIAALQSNGLGLSYLSFQHSSNWFRIIEESKKLYTKFQSNPNLDLAEMKIESVTNKYSKNYAAFKDIKETNQCHQNWFVRWGSEAHDGDSEVEYEITPYKYWDDLSIDKIGVDDSQLGNNCNELRNGLLNQIVDYEDPINSTTTTYNYTSRFSFPQIVGTDNHDAEFYQPTASYIYKINQNFIVNTSSVNGKPFPVTMNCDQPFEIFDILPSYNMCDDEDNCGKFNYAPIRIKKMTCQFVINGLEIYSPGTKELLAKANVSGEMVKGLGIDLWDVVYNDVEFLNIDN